jgi:hypothetical protein
MKVIVFYGRKYFADRMYSMFLKRDINRPVIRPDRDSAVNNENNNKYGKENKKRRSVFYFFCR